MALDTEVRYLISVGEDGVLAVTDINTKEPIFETLVNVAGLKALIFDSENKRCFVADAEGWIYIFSFKTYPPELIIKVQSHSASCIRSICLDETKQFLFSCDVDGFISTFQIGAVGKEKLCKFAKHMKGLVKTRVINWS